MHYFRSHGNPTGITLVRQPLACSVMHAVKPSTCILCDFIYASGDQNFDDHQQNAIKIDPNFESGLLLFRHVLAAQTARGPITAGDPNLVGSPSENLDRFPTRRSISNTYSLL